MLFIVVVLFYEIIIKVTSCPLATINCIYDDDVTSTVNTTQYCHVDNYKWEYTVKPLISEH